MLKSQGIPRDQPILLGLNHPGVNFAVLAPDRINTERSRVAGQVKKSARPITSFNGM